MAVNNFVDTAPLGQGLAQLGGALGQVTQAREASQFKIDMLNREEAKQKETNVKYAEVFKGANDLGSKLISQGNVSTYTVKQKQREYIIAQARALQLDPYDVTSKFNALQPDKYKSEAGSKLSADTANDMYESAVAGYITREINNGTLSPDIIKKAEAGDADGAMALLMTHIDAENSRAKEVQKLETTVKQLQVAGARADLTASQAQANYYNAKRNAEMLQYKYADIIEEKVASASRIVAERVHKGKLDANSAVAEIRRLVTESMKPYGNGVMGAVGAYFKENTTALNTTYGGLKSELEQGKETTKAYSELLVAQNEARSAAFLSKLSPDLQVVAKYFPAQQGILTGEFLKQIRTLDSTSQDDIIKALENPNMSVNKTAQKKGQPTIAGDAQGVVNLFVTASKTNPNDIRVEAHSQGARMNLIKNSDAYYNMLASELTAMQKLPTRNTTQENQIMKMLDILDDYRAQYKKVLAAQQSK